MAASCGLLRLCEGGGPVVGRAVLPDAIRKPAAVAGGAIRELLQGTDAHDALKVGGEGTVENKNQ
jgi:hypothetical protein